jgi:hypothetical protein
VILADITLNSKKSGGSSGIDIKCEPHRRYVASFAEFYFMCREKSRGKYPDDVVKQLNKEGVRQMERAAPDKPLEAIKLKAVHLLGVSSRSSLGKMLKGKSISDVAEMNRETFVADAVKGLPQAESARVKKQAEEVHDTANRVVLISKEWAETLTRAPK